MKDVDLRKLLTRRYGSSAINELVGAIDSSFEIRDPGGNTISGKAGTRGAGSPVKLGEKIIGWVLGEKASVVADFLGFLACKDRDIRCLANETLEKYKEITVFYDMNEKMAECLETETIANLIITEAMKMIQADNVSVMLLNEDTGILEIVAASGIEFHPRTPLKAGKGIAGSVLSKGRAEIVNDVLSDRRFVEGTNRMRSMLCAPFKIKEKVIGVINVSTLTPFLYTAADLKLLSTLALQAASAIEIARLYDAQRMLNKELQAAREMLSRENTSLKQSLRREFSPIRILGVSRQIKDVKEKVGKLSDTTANVLVTGETGTGKELVAKTIHYNSSRMGKPFVAINCSAVPESIFESEMFGIEKGVATGVEKRTGKIENADGGTLFLDEIGDMPLSSQAKMLRVIENLQLERVGGREPIPVDIRIIAATNKDLKKKLSEGTFREDLFYRLKVVDLHLPPLRERKDDIPILLSFFLDQCLSRLGREGVSFSPEAVEILKCYNWPGNVRELENEVERAVTLCNSDVITINDLSEELRCSRDGVPREIRSATVSDTEKTLILQALAKTGGNKSKAAESLGISREGLRKKMKRHGLV